MTTYNTLLSASGLSLREAADYHNVRLDTVKSWSSGRNGVPDGAIDEIYNLVARQLQAAQQAANHITTTIEQRGTPEDIELGICTDDHEAQSLGWPCASTHKVVIGLTIGLLPPDIAALVVIVPRGSTPASAAAEISQ